MKAEQRLSGNGMPEIDWRAEVNALGRSQGLSTFEAIAIVVASSLALAPVLLLITLVPVSPELGLGVLVTVIAVVALVCLRFMRRGQPR